MKPIRRLALTLVAFVLAIVPIAAQSYATTGLTHRFDAGTRVFADTSMTTPATNGVAVDAWDDDDDGEDRALFPSVSGAGPLYVTNAIAGLPCVDFDGAGDQLISYDDSWTTQQGIAAFINTTAQTVFVAFQMEGDATNNGTVYLNTALVGDTGQFWGLFLKTSAGTHTINGYSWDGNADTVGLTITQGVPVVVMFRHESGNLYLSVNGGAESSVASGARTGGGSLHVGQVSGGQLFTGKICEKLYYNVALSGSDLSDTMTYMVNRWTGGGGGSPVVSPGSIGSWLGPLFAD